MRYMVVIEKGEKSYGAHVPDLPGCIAAGQTKKETMQLIHRAIELHIEDLKDQGLPIPPPSSESEFVEIPAA